MLESFDPEVFQIIHGMSQEPLFDLRPERNYLSAAVLEALGSPLADHFLEGHPGQRFVPGTAAAEEIARLGNERLKKLFDAEEATLQPADHAQAIAAVLDGILQPGDTVLAPVAGAGCSLVVGHKRSVWADRFRFVRYGPDPETELFDLDAINRLATRCAPSLIVVAVYPYPRHQDLAFWRELADRAGALLLVDLGVAAGLVPGGCMPSPTRFADLVTGATHGLLRGPAGGFILARRPLYDKVLTGLFPKLQAGEQSQQIAAKAVALKEASSSQYRAYVSHCLAQAKELSHHLTGRGFDPWAGGTDFSYFMIDLKPLGLDVLNVERHLLNAGIAVGKTSIPYEKVCAARREALVIGAQALAMKHGENAALESLAEKMAHSLSSINV